MNHIEITNQATKILTATEIENRSYNDVLANYPEAAALLRNDDSKYFDPLLKSLVERLAEQLIKDGILTKEQLKDVFE